MKKRVLSGIRATGRLHLGNYLGAVKGFLALQNDSDYETFYMVADLHSINTPYDPKTLKDKVKDVVLDYLSAGVDPEKSTIFVQSQIPEHTELSYLFSTVLTVARMLHLPTYKDKLKESSENANMAMLYYPVLMASDILIYKAHAVPVGDDQLPHLEVAREVARKMNAKYGTDFPEPEQFKTSGHYVPSLTGEGKMSKSIEGSFINLTDSFEDIKSKLAKVPTDSGKGYIDHGFYLSSASVHGGGNVKNIAPSGGVKTLMVLVELFEGEEKRKHYEKLYTGDGIKYSELKEELAQAIYKELEPIQKRRTELEKNPEYVDKVLQEGAAKARKVAQKTVEEVREKMGLG